jgi:hypothetical protein
MKFNNEETTNHVSLCRPSKNHFIVIRMFRHALPGGLDSLDLWHPDVRLRLVEKSAYTALVGGIVVVCIALQVVSRIQESEK